MKKLKKRNRGRKKIGEEDTKKAEDRSKRRNGNKGEKVTRQEGVKRKQGMNNVRKDEREQTGKKRRR